MYVPEPFREDRPAVLIAAIRDIALATWVTCAEGAYHTTRAPVVVSEDADGLTLSSHLARANPHGLALAGSPPSLALFEGPHAYVSPAWYASKREHGRVVPTWAYIAIEAEGPLEAIADPAWLRAHLESLTGLHESGREEPWSVSDAPADYVARLAGAIVGVRMRVARLQGAWKLNQHRSDADRAAVISALSREDGPARRVAEVMARLGKDRPPA